MLTGILLLKKGFDWVFLTDVGIIKPKKSAIQKSKQH
jgi:hypothetical protein